MRVVEHVVLHGMSFVNITSFICSSMMLSVSHFPLAFHPPYQLQRSVLYHRGYFCFFFNHSKMTETTHDHKDEVIQSERDQSKIFSDLKLKPHLAHLKSGCGSKSLL